MKYLYGYQKYPRQDPCTGEWLWRGKWYDRYPAKEIKEYEEAIDDYWERRLDESRDTTGKAWHGGGNDSDG